MCARHGQRLDRSEGWSLDFEKFGLIVIMSRRDTLLSPRNTTLAPVLQNLRPSQFEQRPFPKGELYLRVFTHVTIAWSCDSGWFFRGQVKGTPPA